MGGPPYKPLSRRVCLDEEDSDDTLSKGQIALVLMHDEDVASSKQIASSDVVSRRPHRAKRKAKSDALGTYASTRLQSRQSSVAQTKDQEISPPSTQSCRSESALLEQSLTLCRPSESYFTKTAGGPVRPEDKNDRPHHSASWTSPTPDPGNEVRGHGRDTKARHATRRSTQPEMGHEFLAEIDPQCFVQCARLTTIPPHERSLRQMRRLRPKMSKVSFLSLPGEIRNQVYSLLIPSMRILVVGNRPNKELQVAQKLWCNADTIQARSHFRLSHIADSRHIEQGLTLTTNLLLACQEIKSDVETFLYARTTFCFTSAKVLHRFLNRASPSGLRVIEKVEIQQAGYNHARLLNNDIYRRKYYRSWARVCDRAGQAMTNLRSVYLRVEIFDWPLDIDDDLDDSMWKHSLVKLAPKRVDQVEVSLSHHMLSQDVARDLSHRLEDCMMTEGGRLRRDEAETRQVMRQLKAQKRATASAARRAEQAMSDRPSAQLVISIQDVLQAQQDYNSSLGSKSKPVKSNLTGYTYIK